MSVPDVSPSITQAKVSRERKRTVAAVKETEKTLHCIIWPRGPNWLRMFPWKPKHTQNLFRHKFSLLVVGPTERGKTFFVEKFSQRIVLFTRARNRGKYGGTSVSGRVATKWCSHLSERKFSLIFVAFQSLRADVSKYRPEVYKSEKSKILKKNHKVALGKILT